MKSLLIIAIVSVSGCLSNPVEQEKQGSQVLQCYDDADFGGDIVRLISYTPDLIPYNFDNRIASCCFNGIWMLYDDYYFNKDNFKAAVFYAWGEDHCINVPSTFNNKASSVRLAGRPEGYKFDTVTFYDGEYFMGDQQNVFQDIPQVQKDNLGRSVIVTGCSPWTIYSNANYQGSCFCVFPQDSDVCKPGFYETAAALGGLSQQVSSTRKGCFCANKVYPKSTEGQEGFFEIKN